MAYLNEDGLNSLIEQLGLKFSSYNIVDDYDSSYVLRLWGSPGPRGKLDLRHIIPIDYKTLHYTTTGSLKPGRFYRITDYSSCLPINQSKNIAQRPFDILVQATSDSTLSPEAWVIPTEGDTNFTTEELSQLKIWYDPDWEAVHKPDWVVDYFPGYDTLLRLRKPLTTYSVTFIDSESTTNYDGGGWFDEQLYALSFGEPVEGDYELRLHQRRICNQVDCINDPCGYAVYVGEVYRGKWRSLWKEADSNIDVYVETDSIFDGDAWNDSWFFMDSEFIDGNSIKILGRELTNSDGSTYILNLANSNGGSFARVVFDKIEPLLMHYTGRITRMIDERNNDCDYDFKNVLSTFAYQTSIDGETYGYYDYTFGLGFRGDDYWRVLLQDQSTNVANHHNKIRNSDMNIIECEYVTSIGSTGVVRDTAHCELINNAWIYAQAWYSKFINNDTTFVKDTYNVSIKNCCDCDINNANNSNLYHLTECTFDEIDNSTISNCNTTRVLYISCSTMNNCVGLGGNFIDSCKLNDVGGLCSLYNVVNKGPLYLMGPDQEDTEVTNIDFRGEVTIREKNDIWEKLLEDPNTYRTCAVNSNGEIKVYCEADLIA